MHNVNSKKRKIKLYRLFDIFFGIIFSILSLPIFIIVPLLIKLDSSGPVFFISDRIGKNNKKFKMIKFRSMLVDTEIVESSKLKNPKFKITRLGKILRYFSIDEIPQLFCVLKGSMSIVGPRPALASQFNLLRLRKKYGIDLLKPGITGYAQINGRDLLTDKKKIELEFEYLNKKNFITDLKIIYKTFFIVLKKKGISH